MGEVIAVALCCLLGAWIFQSIRNEFLAGEIRVLLSRAKAVLGVLEGQHKATDAVAARVVSEVQDVKRDTVRAAQAACETRQAIEDVPSRVAEKLASDTAADSGKVPVVPKPSPGE